MTSEKIVRDLMISAGILIFLYLLFLLRTILTPFFIAFFLAYLLDPAIDFLEKRKVPRMVGILTLLLILLLILALLVFILYPILRLQLDILIENIPEYIKTIRGWFEPIIERVIRQNPERARLLIEEGLKRLGTLPAQLLKGTTNFFWESLSSLFNLVILLLNLLIIPVATIYFLKDIDRIKEGIQAYLPIAFRDNIIGLFKEIDLVLSGFIRGQLLVALILAGLYSLGLTLCQVPMGLLIGIVAGFVSIIPYLGLIIGLVPALLLSFLQYRTWESLLYVIGVFALVQALEGIMITPKIVGDKIGLHPIMVMVVVLIGGKLFGFFGILLAVPVAAVVNVFVKRGLRSYKESPLFKGNS
jgi:predicted PurR-regulated permease PerM